MDRNDIQYILAHEPTLTYEGFGLALSSQSRRETDAGEIAKRFKESRLLLLNSSKKCSLVCDWLDGLKTIKSINMRVDSYSLKHMVERYAGEYVSNGQFICAAIFMGFDRLEASPNAYFNISNREITRRLKALNRQENRRAK